MIGALQAAPRRLASLVRASWPHRSLVAEACASLIAAQAKLKLTGSKQHVLRGLEPDAGRRGDGALTPIGETDARIATEIGWVVTRVARYLPSGPLCLAQALAARRMLRRRGIDSVMHVGVARPDEAAFKAHAWLEAAGVEVTGYPVPPELHPIGLLRSSR